jgi:hypothetical protein
MVNVADVGAANDELELAFTRRNPLGSFVNDTNIRDSTRADAVINILILAENDVGGLIGMLGHGLRTGWFARMSDTLFASDGPLSPFIPIQSGLLMRHFGTAERLAQSIWNRNHSNEQSGAGQETIAAWVQQFARLFEAQSNNPSAAAQADAIRDERRMVLPA